MNMPTELNREFGDDVSPMDITKSLALELVAGLAPPHEIFERHGIDEESAKKLLSSPQFKSVLSEAKQEWHAETNTPERIRLKAQTCLEDLIPSTYAMAKSPKVPPAARMDAVKTFERMAGISKSEDGNGGPKYVLTINLGKDAEPKTIEGAVVDQ